METNASTSKCRGVDLRTLVASLRNHPERLSVYETAGPLLLA